MNDRRRLADFILRSCHNAEYWPRRCAANTDFWFLYFQRSGQCQRFFSAAIRHARAIARPDKAYTIAGVFYHSLISLLI